MPGRLQASGQPVLRGHRTLVIASSPFPVILHHLLLLVFLPDPKPFPLLRPAPALPLSSSWPGEGGYPKRSIT